MEEATELKEDLGVHISDKPIDLLSGIDGLAVSRRFSNVKNKESELVANYLEYENPSLIQEVANRE